MALTLVSHALCGLEDARQHYAADTSSQHDDYLTQAINAFSTAAEEMCGRHFEITERTEYFDAGIPGGPKGPTAQIALSAFPISLTATLTIYDDNRRQFASSSLLTVNTDYVVNYDLGTITRISTRYFDAGFDLTGGGWGRGRFQAELDPPHFTPGVQSIKVTYTGGLVTPQLNDDGTPVGPSVVPDDLRTACAMQVAYWAKARSSPGLVSAQGTGFGGVTFYRDPTQYLPWVRETISNYCRLGSF